MNEKVNAWHELRFHMKIQVDWKSAEPVHLLIADVLLSPWIEQFEREFVAWRIHRMYGDPEGTHRFMFKYYGPDYIGSLIKDKIESNEILGKLERCEGLRLEGFVSKGRHLEDDCDESWPKEIRAIWPYYICGASKAWIKLVGKIASGRTEFQSDIPYESRKRIYSEVRDEVDERWTEHGGHAMLHHLNAVFGYKFIRILRPAPLIRNLQETLLQNKKPAIFAEINF